MDVVELADYREAVARLYLSDAGLAEFRAQRDALFATHPQSPIPADERAGFGGLPYFPPAEDAITDVDVRERPGRIEIDTGGPDGVMRYERVGVLDTPWGPLSLWWIAAYGGGLYLPFRDTTCGTETYGGGRYLTDTVKGTFGRGVRLLGSGRLRLDFNYAYNPSCAYDSRWACPLAPPENWLRAPVRAGERAYPGGQV
jgi:uncharacterized protein (DUF1684 family)